MSDGEKSADQGVAPEPANEDVAPAHDKARSEVADTTEAAPREDD